MTKRGFQSIADITAQTKALLASSDLPAEQRADAEAFCEQLASVSAEDVAVYDFFFQHMPEDDDDPTLVILKGHLLVELRTREFVRERLLSPDALNSARLSSFQLICVAESMCLPNHEPQWLWGTAKRLNKLRNSLAHNLQPEDLQQEIASFTCLFNAQHTISSGLVGCIGFLYAQVAALAGIAREPSFRFPPSD